MNIKKIQTQNWDWIIVGTGMGGGTFGYSLASRGMKVLFLESGINTHERNKGIRGKYAEETSMGAGDMAACGRRVAPLEDRSKKNKSHSFTPFIGEGVGGSSAIYGALLDRFDKEDFSKWPIASEKMNSYYEVVESLYHAQAPDIGSLPTSLELANYFHKRGLQPMAAKIAHAPSTPGHSCQGALCEQRTKYGSYEACIRPAIEFFGAELLDEVKVISIDSDKSKAHSILCERAGTQFRLGAANYALAGGALETPGMLLRSTNSYWPQGLGNDNDMVGRGLMRHYTDLYLIRPQNRVGVTEKTLIVRDFPIVDGRRLGTLQSFGALPAARAMAVEIAEGISFQPLKKIVTLVLSKFFDFLRTQVTVMATIMEDTFNRENRVGWDFEKNCTWVQYQISNPEKNRIQLMRENVKQILKGYTVIPSFQAENVKRIAHACGTCRMGTDPLTSVVDENGKVHGLSNIYIVDSSVLPTSGSTNPGLTIAANAMRMAEVFLSKVQSSSVYENSNSHSVKDLDRATSES